MKKEVFKTISITILFVALTACIPGTDTSTTVSNETQTQTETKEKPEETSESSKETQTTVSTSTASVSTTSAQTVTEETTVISEVSGVKHDILRVINQRSTPFGDMGCGGAAALMGLQALGKLTNLKSDADLADFWNTIPKSYNPTKGWNENTGIWNPAYCSWISDYTYAKQITEFDALDIKNYLSDGYICIPLVSLGDSGYATHWITVYGWFERDDVLFFNVADPWGGGLHEYTKNKLEEKIKTAAKRKGMLGYGGYTDGVIIKSE